MCVRTLRCASTQRIFVMGGSQDDDEPIGGVDVYAVAEQSWLDAELTLPRRSPNVDGRGADGRQRGDGAKPARPPQQGAAAP